MRQAADIWRERSWTWIVPLAFVVLNLIVFGIYRARYAGGVEKLEEAYQNDADVLAKLQESVSQAQGLLTRAERQQEEIDLLYEAHFATETERFTGLLREVRQLARTAGLDPGAFNYPEVELQEFALVERQVNFGVSGTYDQLRTFLNLLELSDQFVTLKQVALGGSSTGSASPVLNVQLSLTTYFLDTGFDPENPRRGVS
ncbi:MAG: type 4a pilus biogenesis protein PilO [Thermoanaerobaculia bacterium]|nr:type 4a pilus biogenesis protein PilO [Thermoanaerobaculia bacterium]